MACGMEKIRTKMAVVHQKVIFHHTKARWSVRGDEKIKRSAFRNAQPVDGLEVKQYSAILSACNLKRNARISAELVLGSSRSALLYAVPGKKGNGLQGRIPKPDRIGL